MTITETEILQKQVDALEKLLQIKEAIIEEQEKKIRGLERDQVYIAPRQFPQQPYQPQYPGAPMPHISLPSVFGEICSKGGFHTYPNPWHSTSPAPCDKCGKLMQNLTTTSSNTIKIDDGTTEL